MLCLLLLSTSEEVFYLGCFYFFFIFYSVLTNIWSARDSRLQTLDNSRDNCMRSGSASTTETGAEGEFLIGRSSYGNAPEIKMKQ